VLNVSTAEGILIYYLPVSVTDLENRMLQRLNEEMEDAIWLVIALAMMELVEPCDEEWVTGYECA